MFQGDFDGDTCHLGTFEKQIITGYCKLCEIHSPFIEGKSMPVVRDGNFGVFLKSRFWKNPFASN